MEHFFIFRFSYKYYFLCKTERMSFKSDKTIPISIFDSFQYQIVVIKIVLI